MQMDLMDRSPKDWWIQREPSSHVEKSSIQTQSKGEIKLWFYQLGKQKYANG